MAARAEAVAVVELVEQAQRARRRLRDSSRSIRGVICGVAGDAEPASRRAWRSRAAITRSRTSAERGAACVAQRVARSGGATAIEQVDAVEQRAAEAAVVAREVGGRAAARRLPDPARARVRRRDEHEARREHA